MKRVNFISVQNSRTIGAEGYVALPFRTSYEQVLAYRTNELFAIVATGDGKVLSITDTTLTVLYDDGTRKVYPIGLKHGVASGTTLPHNVITDFKVGQKFKDKTVLAFNELFFQRNIFKPMLVDYKAGAIVRTALVDDSETIEDGSTVSARVAELLQVRSTSVKTILVDFDQTVNGLPQLGQAIEVDDILCTIQDRTSAELGDEESEVSAALTRLTAKNPKAEVSGTVTRIETIYFGEIEDMSESLQSIVTATDQQRSKRATKLKDGSPKTGRINQQIHVGKKKLLPQMVAIKIYIDYKSTMGNADKVVFSNQLKSTITRVMEQPLRTESGVTVDAKFGNKSIADRQVESVIRSGIMNRNLAALSRKMADIYFGDES